MTSDQLNGLSDSDLLEFSTSQVAALNTDTLSAFNTTQFRALVPQQLQTLSADQLNGLLTSDRTDFGGAQLKYLSGPQVATISTENIASLGTGRLRALRTQQIQNLTTDQISAISDANIRQLTTDQVRALTGTQLSSLSTDTLSALSQSQVRSMTGGQVRSLTSGQLGTLSVDNLREFSTNQIRALKDYQLHDLSTTNRNMLARIGASFWGDPSTANTSTRMTYYQDLDLSLYGGSGSPSLEDINQGQLGDCYFLASLGGLALNDPDAIKNAITDKGNGTFDVTLYAGGLQHVINVSDDLAVQAESGTAQQINGSTVWNQRLLGNNAYSDVTNSWANIFEKAYAKPNGSSYANIANGGTTQAALKALTNGTVNNYQGSSSINANKQAIFDALDNNKVVTLARFSNSYDKNCYQNMVAAHAFTVTGYNSLTNSVTVRNPWGERSSLYGTSKYNSTFQISLGQIASNSNNYFSVLA